MPPLLRFHTDEQLVRSFRGGEEEAFKVIYDRYRQRLFAYARQMLHCRLDAEDALQDVFVRAYSGLRADDRDLALRAWLYRIAHNRCVDELRRPRTAAVELGELVRAPVQDPIAQAEQRESLRRLIEDVRRLPDQQRSALLMRELTGMSYVELAGVLAVSLPAVKSLLVRARVGLAQAAEARETDCDEIREELILAHDCRRRPVSLARRHLRDCAPCREFRSDVRGISRQLAGLVPFGPTALLANLLGFGSGAGSAAGGGAAAGSGAAVGSGTIAGGGLLAAGAGHAVTLLAAAAVTVGGAAEIQHSLSSTGAPRTHHVLAHATAGSAESAPASAHAAGPASSAQASATSVTAPTARGGTTSPPAPASQISQRRGTPARTSARGSVTTGTSAQPMAPAALDPAMGPGPIIGPDANVGGSASSSTGASNAAGSSTPSTTTSSTPLSPGGLSTPSGTAGSAAATGQVQSVSGSSLVPSVTVDQGGAGSPSASPSGPSGTGLGAPSGTGGGAAAGSSQN